MYNRIQHHNVGDVSFKCPGCGQTHRISVNSSVQPNWDWNGSDNFPTFSPSILARSGHYVPGYEQTAPCWCSYNKDHPEDDKPFECVICHSYVTDGQIEFLSDCTHKLAGQTVDLPRYGGDDA